MHRSGIPRRSAVKLLLGVTLLFAVLIVAVGCTSETPEVVATAGPAASPTPQPEATAESASASTEESSPDTTPIPAPTSEPTATSVPTPTPRPTPTPEPTATPRPTPTPTPIPNTPPVITNPADKSYHQGESITAFDIKVNDAEDTPTVAVSSLPDGLSYGSGKVSGTIASDATVKDYTVTISANDGSNPAVSVAFTIAVTENTAPVIINPGNKSYEQGESIAAFDIAVNDAEDTPTVTVSGLPSGLSYQSSQVRGTVASDATVKDYTVTISADDGINPVVPATFIITVTPNNPPIIANPGDDECEDVLTREYSLIEILTDENLMMCLNDALQ